MRYVINNYNIMETNEMWPTRERENSNVNTIGINFGENNNNNDKKKCIRVLTTERSCIYCGTIHPSDHVDYVVCGGSNGEVLQHIIHDYYCRVFIVKFIRSNASTHEPTNTHARRDEWRLETTFRNHIRGTANNIIISNEIITFGRQINNMYCCEWNRSRRSSGGGGAATLTNVCVCVSIAQAFSVWMHLSFPRR